MGFTRARQILHGLDAGALQGFYKAFRQTSQGCHVKVRGSGFW